MRDQRADTRIGQRGEHQIAGERQIDAEQRQRGCGRQAPKNDSKREQRDHAVQKSGAEFVRALQEQQHVVGDAQMNVVDRIVDEADSVVAAFRHPDRDVAFGQPAPPADLQGLAEVILARGRHDRAERDEAEDDKLAREAVPVTRFERIEEARVPLDHGHRYIDKTELGADHTREQQARAPAMFGAKVREGEGEKGAHEVSPHTVQFDRSSDLWADAWATAIKGFA